MNRAATRRPPLPATGLALYLTLISISSLGILAADWADHLILVVLLAWVGALVGVLLAYSRFSGGVAAPFAGAYGLFLLGWQFSNLMDAALPPRERVLALFGRLAAFLRVVGRAEDNPDPLMAVLLIAAIYWLIAAIGAWSLIRWKNPWWAVVPTGVVLLINRFYYFGRAKLDLMLALYVLVTIIFFLQNELADRQGVWRRIRAQVAANAVGHVARTGAIVALLLVGVSWIGPAFARSELAADIWSSVSGPWRRARDRLGNAVASFRSPAWFVRDFGDTLTLDEGALPPDELVMEVDAAGQLAGGVRFYWRARTYDFYQDGRWRDRQGEILEFDPREGDLNLATGSGRQQVELTFRVHRSLDRDLYLPAQPLWVNRSSSVRVQRQDGELVDVAAFAVAEPIFAGESYRARGAIATPTASQLQAAGSDYPAWVLARYLQVPEEVSDRTREAARQVTAELDSPYEKAAAITAWLRQNIEYRRVTDPPPRGQEPLDWFLFEYGAGYCNYYASAQVIMLRSLGIPARLATGYAQGAFDDEQGMYVISARDYHAWPEVYFPGYGWVEFEPTVSQAPLVRSEQGEQAEDLAAEGAAAGSGEIDEFDLIRLLRMRYLRQGDEQLVPEDSGLVKPDRAFPYRRLALLALAVAAASALLWTRLDAGWRLTMAGLAGWAVRALGPQVAPRPLVDLARHSSPAHRAYQRWLSWWPRLGLVPAGDQTPSERARLFSASYPSLAAASSQVAGAYAAERFGGLEADRTALALAWRELGGGLWRLWLANVGQRLLDRLPLPWHPELVPYRPLPPIRRPAPARRPAGPRGQRRT